MTDLDFTRFFFSHCFFCFSKYFVIWTSLFVVKHCGFVFVVVLNSFCLWLNICFVMLVVLNSFVCGQICVCVCWLGLNVVLMVKHVFLGC